LSKITPFKFFVPTDRVFTPAHARYRRARSILPISHEEMFLRAALASQDTITPAQALTDCGVMLTGLVQGRFKVPFYVNKFAHQVAMKYAQRKLAALLSSLTRATTDESEQELIAA
jgi:hypothetical protein